MTTKKTKMPKSVNSKNTNNKCNIKILKGFNGQALVSLEEYKANRHLFLGTPCNNNLRLKDGREVICGEGNWRQGLPHCKSIRQSS